MASARFQAQLIEGHKGVVCALVPFDPLVKWKTPPHRLAGRRHGWPVKGKLNGKPFVGYVGERWGRRFVIVDEATRGRGELAVGDEVKLELSPTKDAAALAAAVEQSKVTTQPKSVRVDAILR